MIYFLSLFYKMPVSKSMNKSQSGGRKRSSRKRSTRKINSSSSTKKRQPKKKSSERKRSRSSSSNNTSSFFDLMLESKKLGVQSFQYKGKTYKRKVSNKNPKMVFYKKA